MCGRCAGLPCCWQRKAERAAEANSDGPLAVQHRECRTSGLTDLGFSQSFLPGSEGQETWHRHTLLPSDMLQDMHTHVYMCTCVRVHVCV